MNNSRRILFACVLSLGVMVQSPVAQDFAPGVLITRPAKPEPKATNIAPVVRGFQEAALFRNGDVLAGLLVSISTNTVTWKHPDAPAPVQLRLPLVFELQLKSESRSHNDST